MKRQFFEFQSIAGTPHKVPIPFKDPKECSHEHWGSYSFDTMRAPTCWDCGKEADGKMSSDALAYYKTIIDKANARAQKDYDRSGASFFYIKNSDGSYRHEYKRKPKTSIFGILFDVFFLEPRERHWLNEAQSHRRR